MKRRVINKISERQKMKINIKLKWSEIIIKNNKYNIKIIIKLYRTMRIGIIYEDYHSEVLDFILELLENELRANILIYNNRDSWNNLDIYLKKYTRIDKRRFKDLKKELDEKICDKIIVLTYTNLYPLSFWKKYKERVIFIAHDKRQKDELEMENYKYFTLTQLLSQNYMIPIVLNKRNDSKETIKSIDIDTGLVPILMVGYLINKNRDIEVIQNLLKSNKVFFFIFCPIQTETINELGKINNNFYYEIKAPTERIDEIIEAYKIKYLLFAPLEESKYYYEQWSGSLAFGLERDLTLIIPKKIADIYNLNECSITYENKNDITEVKLEEKNNNNWKKNVYNRNKEIIKKIINISE